MEKWGSKCRIHGENKIIIMTKTKLSKMSKNLGTREALASSPAMASMTQSQVKEASALFQKLLSVICSGLFLDIHNEEQGS